MGKVAGTLKKMKYGLGKVAAAGLKGVGLAAKGLGGLSGVVGQLHQLVKPGQYAANAAVGIGGKLAQFIPVVGGFLSTAAQAGQKIHEDILESQVADRNMGAVAWTGVGKGLSKLGQFLTPDETKLEFKGISFNKYQIDKKSGEEKLYLYSTNHKLTILISYLNSPIWKCSLSSGKRDCSVVFPLKGDMEFVFNHTMTKVILTGRGIECEDQFGNAFEVIFTKRNPNKVKPITDKRFLITFL